MTTQRTFGALSLVGLVSLLSGCVVAPIGPPGTYYGGSEVYVQPAPVVVVPGPPSAYYGYPGYRSHPGYRNHPGYRGFRYWR